MSVPQTDIMQRAFPKLTPEQIDQLRPYGEVHRTYAHEVLFEAGDREYPLVVMLSGCSAIVDRSERTDRVIHTGGPGDFHGELNLLTGQTAISTCVVTEPGEVLLVPPHAVREIIALLPALNVSAAHAIGGGPRAQPWILALPPMWFLGLYEWILGSTQPLVSQLARRAVLAFTLPLAVVIVTYPLAYRRLMVSMVEAGRHERGRLSRAAQRLLVRLAGRDSAVQAAAEFFTATIGRVERHRFVLAITIGVALAWSLPGLRAYEPSARPEPSILALPIAMMMFLLAGLRVASVLPGDPRASWLFEVHDLSRADARQAVERMMLVLGVLPPVLLSVPLYWHLWGATAALTHAAVMTALGVATTELLIWHCSGMPCGRQWTPARMGFGRRWPLHLAFFLLLVGFVPRLEVLMMRNPFGAAIFIAFLVMLALGARLASARHEIVPTYEEVDPVAGVLRIN